MDIENKTIERIARKELIQKFGEDSIFTIDKNTFLILCKGEAFKIIKAKKKGTNGNHDKVLNWSMHHSIAGELWIYDNSTKDILKEIDVLYKGFL
jgi:hypothetical protein